MASPSRRLQTKPVITCFKSVLLIYTFIFWVRHGDARGREGIPGWGRAEGARIGSGEGRRWWGWGGGRCWDPGAGDDVLGLELGFGHLARAGRGVGRRQPRG